MKHMTNPLATVDQLYHRKRLDALPSELQDVIFFTTQCLTQAAGILLRLPQSVTAQANVVLARYWLSEVPLAYEFSDMSAAVLFLTAKLSAHPCPPRDISNVYAYLLSPASPLFKPPPPARRPPAGSATAAADPSSYYLTDAAYNAFHTRVLKLEARVLSLLSFDTHVALPHPLAITYLQALDFLSHHPRAAISHRAVAYLNTALLSPQMLYLTHQPNALAVAAIYSAARDVGARTPDCAWWEVFDVDREELGFLVVGMRSVEGWAGKMRGHSEEFAGGGMVTRRGVEMELRKRGIVAGNGAVGVVDEEDELMRRMDERAE